MKPSEVRTRIIDDHQLIRSEVNELDSLSKRFEDGEPEVGAELRDRGLELFAAHLNLEDTLLVAALRTLDDGDRLADRLQREHREQRQMLRFLIDRLTEDHRPTSLVAEELRNFGNYVRSDMEHEEATILSAGLLRDD